MKIVLALVAKTIHFGGWDWTLADLIGAAIAVATLLTFLAGFSAVVMAAKANATALAAAKDASKNAAEALKLTEESVQLAHRPSLHVTKTMFVSGTSSIDAESIVQVDLVNTGRYGARRPHLV